MEAPEQNDVPVTETPAAEPVATPAEDAKKGTAYGSVLGIILIVAILVIGAFYVWGERLEKTQPEMPQEGVRGGDANPDGALEGSAGVDVDVQPQ